VKRGTTNAHATPHVLAESACACATARQVARLLTQLYDGWLSETGLQAPQFALLMTLDAHGSVSQAVLGRRYALDKTTMSRNLKLFERKGWITASGADDKRERRFAITAAGHARLAAARPEWKKAQEQLRAGMTAKQWSAMFEAFRIAARATQTAQRFKKANGERKNDGMRSSG
jgi:DNA-binding MarR family transcriptional regulator